MEETQYEICILDKDTLVQEIQKRQDHIYAKWEKDFKEKKHADAILVKGLPSTINQNLVESASLNDVVLMLVFFKPSLVIKDRLEKFINDTEETALPEPIFSNFSEAIIYERFDSDGKRVYSENEALIDFRRILKSKTQAQQVLGQAANGKSQNKGKSHNTDVMPDASCTRNGNNSQSNPTVRHTKNLTNASCEDIKTSHHKPAKDPNLDFDNQCHKKDIASHEYYDQPQQNLEHKTQSEKIIKSWTTVKATEKESCGITRKYFCTLNKEVSEKVIILIGASKTGKTMLVNFIASYFLTKDSSAVKLASGVTDSKTSEITAYTFFSSEHNVYITVIDTPGLNDDSGEEIQAHVQALKTFLANVTAKNICIHAIGFVVQSHMTRLTSANRLVLNYVSSLFGRNVAEHVLVLVTFADFLNKPQVLEAMNNYEVKFRDYFLFNNIILQMSSIIANDIDLCYYKASRESWERCLKMLKDMPPLSVNTMQAIQSEIFATTVVEAAEKDLINELKHFITRQKEECLKQENIPLCEMIWKLATKVYILRYDQQHPERKEVDILKEFLEKLSPEFQICLQAVSLEPTRPLIKRATSVIKKTASQLETNLRSSELVITLGEQISTFCPGCKNNLAKIFKESRCGEGNTHIIHCVKCKHLGLVEIYDLTTKTLKMQNIGTDSNLLNIAFTGPIKAFCQRCKKCPDQIFRATRVGKGNIYGTNCLKCKQSGTMEIESTDEAGHQRDDIINQANKCLDKILAENSVTGIPIQKLVLLEFLKGYLGSEYKEPIELIKACIKSISHQQRTFQTPV